MRVGQPHRGRKPVTKSTPSSDEAIRSVFELEDTISDWDSEYYHPIAEKYYDEAVPDMLAALGAKPGDHVLDAGCGPGVHSIRAAKYGCRVSAIDLSEKMLGHARARADDANVSKDISFSQDDLTKLSLETDSYPFVFNWGVIIHVPDTQAALNHLTRIVSPGGRLALHITNEHSLDFGLEQLVRKILNKPLDSLTTTPYGKGVWYDYNGEQLWVLRFDAKKLTDAMATMGFRRVSRRAAEYTEMQWRTKGPLRSLLLYANRLAYKLRFPAAFSCTQILVFEKETG